MDVRLDLLWLAGKVSPESRRELRKLNSALKVMAFLQGQDLTQASQVHPRPALGPSLERSSMHKELEIKYCDEDKAPPIKGSFVQNSKGFITETGLLVLNVLLSWHALQLIQMLNIIRNLHISDPMHNSYGNAPNCTLPRLLKWTLHRFLMDAVNIIEVNYIASCAYQASSIAGHCGVPAKGNRCLSWGRP